MGRRRRSHDHLQVLARKFCMPSHTFVRAERYRSDKRAIDEAFRRDRFGKRAGAVSFRSPPARRSVRSAYLFLKGDAAELSRTSCFSI
jgi:hypothetical protein